MDEKEIEKKLIEKAEEMEVHDFSLVWENVKDKIAKAPERKPFPWKTVLRAVAACVIFACPFAAAIGISLSTPIIYWDENLKVENVEKEQFESGIVNAEFAIVDIANYEHEGYTLFLTDKNVVKGGSINLCDDIENTTWLLSLKFYHITVQLEEVEFEYDLEYSVGTAEIEYRLKEDLGGLYVYDIRASYNSVNYLMEYTCATEDIQPFLQEFFS